MSQTSSGSPDDGDKGVDAATKSEEEREARAAHVADRPPSAEEEAAADANELDPDVAADEREMDELGANVKGEGEIS